MSYFSDIDIFIREDPASHRRLQRDEVHEVDLETAKKVLSNTTNPQRPSQVADITCTLCKEHITLDCDDPAYWMKHFEFSKMHVGHPIRAHFTDVRG